LRSTLERRPLESGGTLSGSWFREKKCHCQRQLCSNTTTWHTNPAMVLTKVVMDVHLTAMSSSAAQDVERIGDFGSGQKKSAVFTMMLLPKLTGHVQI